MMPFASVCYKGTKLLVDLYLELYTLCTSHTGILKNRNAAIIAIKAFLSV